MEDAEFFRCKVDERFLRPSLRAARYPSSAPIRRTDDGAFVMFCRRSIARRYGDQFTVACRTEYQGQTPPSQLTQALLFVARLIEYLKRDDGNSV